MTQLKNLIVGFDQFVNEMYDPGQEMEAGQPLEKTSNCCGAPIQEDGTCSECGNFAESTEEFPEDELPPVHQEEPEFSTIAEGRKRTPKLGEPSPPLGKGPGGFPNLKPPKNSPKKAEPPKKGGPAGKYKGMKPGDKKNIMEKDPKKMANLGKDGKTKEDKSEKK